MMCVHYGDKIQMCMEGLKQRLEWGINLVCTVLEVEDKHQFTVYSCVCMCDNEREREVWWKRGKV